MGVYCSQVICVGHKFQYGTKVAANLGTLNKIPIIQQQPGKQQPVNLRIPTPLNLRLATTVSNANVSQAGAGRGTPIVTPRVPLMVTAGQVKL